MSSTLNNILQQKLAEIQGQLPPFVKLVKSSEGSFDEILSNETNYVGNSEDSDSYNRDYNSIIESTAKKYNISSAIIKAVIKAESNFNPNVVSSAGAMGLMQLMPDTASGLGVKDVFDPSENIEGGVSFLKDMLNKFGGNLELALAAYNAGPGNVIKYGGIPPFQETEAYVKKIMSYLKNRTFEK
ncbi:MAG: lytic transglycosylase domain-containing protein [Lutisporaceae bacterium]